MRLQVLRLLETLGGGVRVKDEDVLAWANATVAAHAAAAAGEGAASGISSFRDPSLATGHFLLALLTAVEPHAVNQALITPGASPEDREQNAK